MAKIIRFIETVVENFAGLRSKIVNYGNVTNLSGRNGEGKTSIGTAPVWVLWGKDLLGNDYTKDKYSPRPSNYKYDRVFASILLLVDGIEYKFAREIDGKKNNFYVNDIPKSATEFSAAVASLFEQDEFMALYFPAYFFGLHWTKQRELLMKGAAPPLNKTVFIEMSRISKEQKEKDIVANPHAVKLAELLKKHSIADLEAKYKKDKTTLDKAHTEAKGYTKAKKEAFDRAVKPAEQFDVEVAQKESDALLTQIREIQTIIDSAASSNATYTSTEHRIRSLQEQVSASAAGWPALKDEPIQDTCRTCKQPLQDESVQAVTADKERRKAAYQEQHKAVVSKRKAAEAELTTLVWIDVGEQISKRNELEYQRDLLEDAILDCKSYHSLSAELEKAIVDEATTLASLRESTFILDAIKAFKAKEAELQAAEIQSKFTRLSVRLFKYVASREEYDPDFSVQMDGKDYNTLSTGEMIAAGLELTEVLFKQSNLITPVFVDGIGEYTGKLIAYDQVITGRAVPDQDLKIEVDGVDV